MPNVKIKDKLYKELSDYCKLNSISIVDYVNDTIKNALTKDKYGDIPFGIIEQSKNEIAHVQYDEPILNENDTIVNNEPIDEPNNEPIDEPNEPIVEPNVTPVEIHEKTEENKNSVKPKKRILK